VSLIRLKLVKVTKGGVWWVVMDDMVGGVCWLVGLGCGMVSIEENVEQGREEKKLT
jgi:hypothetical protein